MFKQDFDSCVVAGDRIVCEVDGFHCVATAHYDEDTKPDSETMPQAVFSAWANDEWMYVGIAVTVWRCGVKLTGDYDHALWGIDCNFSNKLWGKDCEFPADKPNTNWYLRDVANDLLEFALYGARTKIKELCAEPAA